jgi:hypothetical protein
LVKTQGYKETKETLVDRSPILFYPVAIYVYVMRLSGKMSRG